MGVAARPGSGRRTACAGAGAGASGGDEGSAGSVVAFGGGCKKDGWEGEGVAGGGAAGGGGTAVAAGSWCGWGATCGSTRGGGDAGSAVRSRRALRWGGARMSRGRTGTSWSAAPVSTGDGGKLALVRSSLGSWPASFGAAWADSKAAPGGEARCVWSDQGCGRICGDAPHCICPA